MSDLSRRAILGLFLGAAYGSVGTEAEVFAQQGNPETSIAMERWLELVLHAKSIEFSFVYGPLQGSNVLLARTDFLDEQFSAG